MTSHGEAPREIAFEGRVRYFVLGTLGSTAKSTVYRAWDDEQQQEVALKLLRASHEDGRVDGAQEYYLRREFRLRCGIQHPNLVSVYDLNIDGTHRYFTMELVEGESFVAHVRDERDRQPAWYRLALAGVQLARGLVSLHAQRFLHRDVKPENVIVTPEHRVVLLDFDLAVPERASHTLHAERDWFAGTPAYLAPELFEGVPATAASDWYSVGVMFHEALGGALRAEQGSSRRRLSHLDPSLPPALEALLDGLVSRNPASRPSGREVLRVLEACVAGVATDRARVLSPVGDEGALDEVFAAPFVGRQSELAAFCRTFDESLRRRAMRLVTVRGPSGIGKTTLVKRALTDCEKGTEVLTLHSRCNAREALPFKTLDGVVSGLARLLANLGDRASSRLPPLAPALSMLFPVLRMALRASDGAAVPPEPLEVRRQATRELVELIDHVARLWPLALWIDDVQWGDHDSVPLLRALLTRRTDSPLLVVLSWRSDDERHAPALDALREALREVPDAARLDLTLAALSPDEVAQLAWTVLGRGAWDSTRGLESLVREADGSPLLTRVLAEASGDLSRDRPLRLAEVFERRLAALSDDARELLELAALAAAPLPLRVLLRAHRNAARARASLGALQRDFLRTTPVGADVSLTCYHDRLREVVLASMPPERTRERHGQIAAALAEGNLDASDPALRLEHLLGADDAHGAARCAWEMGLRADEGVAFALAAQLYETALTQSSRLDGWRSPGRVEMLTRLAGALANAGRGTDAAARYAEAAALAAREGRAREQVLSLERLAYTHDLRNGQIERGFARMRRTLHAYGVSMPDTEQSAMREALVTRALVVAKGARVVDAPGRGGAADLARLDALWTAGTSLGLVRPMLADALGLRHLREAFTVGDPSRLARALSHEAAFEASIGGVFFRRRAVELLASAERLARSTGADADRGWVLLSAGIVAFVGARWREADALHTECLDVLRGRCVGVSWEVVLAEAFKITSMAYLGELRAVEQRLAAAIDEARTRGDVFGATHLTLGFPGMAWVARGHADEAVARVDRAIEAWPRGVFLTQHYLHFQAAVQALLGADRAVDAWARVEAAWPLVEAHHWLQLEYSRGELHHLRGRAALALAREHRARRPEMFKVVRRCEARIGETKLPWTTALADSLRAGRLALEGDRAGVVRALDEAAAGFRAAEMALHADVAQVLRALWDGSPGMRARADVARAALERQGVSDFDAVARSLYPAVLP